MKRNFIYNFILTGSNLLFPLLTFPYLSRVIGAEGLGINNFILSYSQNFIILAALGLPVYGVREIARTATNKIKRSELFFELLILHLATTLFFLFAYLISISLLKEFKSYKTLSYAGGILLFANAFTCEWLFSGVSDFKYIALRSVFIKIVALLAIFTFVKQSEDFALYFFIYLAQSIITATINLNYAKKYIALVKIKSKNILRHIRPLATLGLYIVLTSLYTTLPNVLLGFYSTKAAVGYFYGSNKIIRIVISFFEAISIVMIPKLNTLIAENKDLEYKSLIQKSLHISLSIGIPLSFFLYLIAKPLVLLLAGNEFHKSVICVEIMSPIILIVAFAQIYCMQILSVNRKDIKLVKLAGLGMLINMTLNLILIPYYAEIATAFSQLLSELTVTFLAILWARKMVALKFPLKIAILNTIFAIPFALIIIPISHNTESNLIILILGTAACGIYFVCYQLFILKDYILLEIVQIYINKIKTLKLT